MKKLSALMLCLVLILTFTFSVSSADEKKKPDVRELEEYGQQHFYLGDPFSSSNAPNTEDAKVSEGEYPISYEYKKGDKCSAITDKDKSAKIIDNEWVRVYLGYDSEHLYVAMETKDANYIKEKDGFGINLGFRDGGRPLDAISRCCIDLYSHKDAEEGDITTLKTKCRKLYKKDNGDWDDSLSNEDGMLYIEGGSLYHDDNTDITTLEVKIELQYILKEAKNDLPIHEIRAYFFPFVYAYGESQKGAGDVVSQGALWSYLPSSYVEELKSQFAIEYPESTYWSSIIPNIIHFSHDPEFTTITTAPTTTTAITTVEATEEITVTETVANLTTVEEANTSGCNGELALLPASILVLASAVLIKRKKEN